MNKETLTSIVAKMMEHPKGLLAIDESSPSANKRFEAVGVEPTEENRRLYRQLLVTAPSIEQFVSGYIMYDETIRQKTDGGALFPEFLEKKGILPGIKVDTGKDPDEQSPEETLTHGLEGLEERLKEYATMGAKFTKWRAVIKIDDDLPTEHNIEEECRNLAKYARIVQSFDMVPVVEPEILINGDHTIERSYEVCVKTWTTLFEELQKEQVFLPGLILKTGFVISGKDADHQASADQVAMQTVKAFKETVPSDIGGIVFLSGGISPENSTIYLNRIHEMYDDLPWAVSFSYSRAIQNPVLQIWANDKNAIKKAQEALVFRANMNSLAVSGEYKESFEQKRPY